MNRCATPSATSFLQAGTALRLLAIAGLLAILVPTAPPSKAQGPESATPSTTSHAGAMSAAGAPAGTAQTVSSGLTDEPIFAGEIVHVSVFNAPDFSTVMRVSQSGDIGIPYLGAVHVAGLSSVSAADLITGELKERNLILDPRLMVTVESTTTGITVLGEVRSPGIYPPTGKQMLSDVLALAGGVTVNTGRVIEISSQAAPEQKTYVPWDPTMHNTSSYDRIIYPGQRVLVRACGFVYVGGSVGRPGAYAPCGSPVMTLSQMISLAGGISGSPRMDHTILARPNPDGTKTIYQVDLDKVLKGERPDLTVHDEDIVYVPSSYLKATLKKLPDYIFGFGTALLYVYR
jgi:polysaccharide biosynthesis/export protein